MGVCFEAGWLHFLLTKVSSFLDILFSIRQGDPLAALLFILYIEPFLVRLELLFMASWWPTSGRLPLDTWMMLISLSLIHI